MAFFMELSEVRLVDRFRLPASSVAVTAEGVAIAVGATVKD